MLTLVVDDSVIQGAFDGNNSCLACLGLMRARRILVAMTSTMYNNWAAVVNKEPKTPLQQVSQPFLNNWRTAMLAERKITTVRDVPENKTLRSQQNHPQWSIIQRTAPLVELAITQSKIIVFNASRSFDCNEMSRITASLPDQDVNDICWKSTTDSSTQQWFSQLQ